MNILYGVIKTLSDHHINTERTALNLLPINSLVTQRAGKKRQLQPFRDKWGLRGLSVSSGSIYRGLCSELGMETVKVTDTGNAEEDLKYRLGLAMDAREYDFIHVHTKMPDEAGHTKNPWYKKEVIEAIDRAMSFAVNEIIHDREVSAGSLLLIIRQRVSGTMIHTGESIPLSMIGKYVRKDDVTEFNEVSCARGSLAMVKGTELIYLILNFLDRAKVVWD
jgi:2,3-bisphosphoglycerate-independent phosphoglycerate mutase